MPLCWRRSVLINGRFQKASVKNQCLFHAIDDCLAGEEREGQRTPVYCEELLPPLSLSLLFWLSSSLSSFPEQTLMCSFPPSITTLFVGLSSFCLLKFCITRPHLLWEKRTVARQTQTEYNLEEERRQKLQRPRLVL